MEPKPGMITDMEQARVGAEAEKPLRDAAREQGVTAEDKAVLDSHAEKQGEQAMQRYVTNIAETKEGIAKVRQELGLEPTEFEVPSVTASEKGLLRSTDSKQDQKENSGFSEETRKELSDFFVESLTIEKKMVENDVEHIRGIVRDSSIEAFKNLMIFSRVVQKLSQDSRVPEKYRMALKIHTMDLDPVGARETFPGVNSYALAINSVVSVLDKILTKEISVAIHAYAEKIFVPPAQDYAKHGPEPFDGVLFKKGE